MKFSKKSAVNVAGAVVMASLFSVSAFADSRHPNETVANDNWRTGDRYERRDDRRDDRRNDRRDDRRRDRVTLGGVVERIDLRRDVIVLRESRTGRAIVVDMDRVDSRSRRADLNDLRRGDYVRLTGEWDRDGFEAYRIDDVSRRRGRR